MCNQALKCVPRYFSYRPPFVLPVANENKHKLNPNQYFDNFAGKSRDIPVLHSAPDSLYNISCVKSVASCSTGVRIINDKHICRNSQQTAAT